MKPINDTGWKPFENVQSDGAGGASARVQPVTGLEQRPCILCRSWEKNDRKLRKHIASKKDIEVLPDGTFRHLADQDIKGRESHTYNVRDFGFCRLHGQPAQQLHSCSNWIPTRRIAELQRKFGR